MSLPRYPKYRDSGLAWLDEVPEHWVTTKTKHVVQFTTGWTPPTGDAASFDGDNLWANISDLGPRLILDTAKRISDEAISTSRMRMSPKGSLLFSFKLSIGQVSFAGQDMFTNEAIATFLPSPTLCLDHGYYAFPLLLTQNAAENIYGARLLNQELIRAASLVLPSVSEQALIATFLDRETAKIDALVAEQRRLIDLLKEKRQAVISHAVTKGLDPHAPLKPSGIEWLGDVPAHWHVTPIGHLCDSLSYGFTNPMPTTDDGPYMLTANDVDYGSVNYETARRTSREAYLNALTEKSRPKKGDVLITKDGTLGRVALHDGREACINQSVASLRVKTDSIRPGFIATCLLVACTG